jgi:hypothetical protein
MVENELPIGSILKEVSIVEDQEFGSAELCLDRVQLIFQDTAVILQPLADTDEIEIISSSVPSLTNQAPSSPDSTLITSPTWYSSLLVKSFRWYGSVKLSRVSRSNCFAFEQFHPSIAFIAEGSVLKVFRYQQITHAKVSDKPLKYSQV